MRLVLELPADWPADVHLELVHPRPRPCDPRTWTRSLLATDDDARVLHARQLATDDGWSFDLILLRDRCVAIYTFRDHVAAAVLTGLAQLTPAIERAFRAARPDWHAETPAALVDLWR